MDIRALHDAPGTGVLVIAGGGTRAAAELLETPGASRTLLELRVPYAAAAMADFLGGEPDRACDPDTARALAMAAFRRARALDPDAAFGVACTASLVTDRPKQGAHRVHVALQTAGRTHLWSLELERGARDRAGEERVCADLMLIAVAEAKGVEPGIDLDLRAGETLAEDRHDAREHWRDLLLGATLATGGDAHREPGRTTTPRIVFPGAFNPLHPGHLEMARIAEERFGVPVEFEICVVNVDKPPLNYADLARRTGGFPSSARVWLTAAPTFIEKARLFPNSTFVVGIDTLIRIADPKYYAGSSERRDAAIAEMRELGIRFLAFGRLLDGRFLGADDLDLPASLRELVESVDEDGFRADISSSSLREHARERG